MSFRVGWILRDKPHDVILNTAQQCKKLFSIPYYAIGLLRLKGLCLTRRSRYSLFVLQQFLNISRYIRLTDLYIRSHTWCKLILKNKCICFSIDVAIFNTTRHLNSSFCQVLLYWLMYATAITVSVLENSFSCWLDYTRCCCICFHSISNT